MQIPEKPLVIAADSSDEALAFAVEILRAISDGGGSAAERAIVVNEPSALRGLAYGIYDIIALVKSEKVEKHLGLFPRERHTIITRHKGSMLGEPDISLGTVPAPYFQTTLTRMGYSQNEASSLSRKTGNSVTILRRHESIVEEIKHPPWSIGNDDKLRQLIPLILIGAWSTGSKSDLQAIQALTVGSFEDPESTVIEFLKFSDPPVWKVGNQQGMVSKLDALYIVASLVTTAHLESFFREAKKIISRSSSHFQQSLCETLLILASHGNKLFRYRLGIDVEQKVNRIIQDLLTPISAEVWNSLRGSLPLLVEAAPDILLEVLERDLGEDKPTVWTLFQPTTSVLFNGCPRTELLWALEGLAWDPEHLSRVVSILAELSSIELNNNVQNKPINSLKSIFQSWLPQTAANVEQRKRAISSIVESHPETAWQICVEQFRFDFRTGNYNYRPRFRNEAVGLSDGVCDDEIQDFTGHVLDIALDWETHDVRTLCTLVESIKFLQEPDQVRIWRLIGYWCRTNPEDTDKVALRETIKHCALSRHSQSLDISEHSRAKAQEAYEKLEPDDLILRHQCLFASDAIHLLAYELEDHEIGSQTAKRHLQSLRVQALEEIWLSHRLLGILDLLACPVDAYDIGYSLKAIVSEVLDVVVIELINHEGPVEAKRLDDCLVGLLATQEQKVLELLFEDAVSSYSSRKAGEEVLVRILCCSPFRKSTWDWVHKAGDPVRRRYWREVNPRCITDVVSELEIAIDELLDAGRPRVALYVTRPYTKLIKLIGSSQLIQILRNVTKGATDRLDHYHLSSPNVFALSVRTILSELSCREGVSRQELAWLELPYISVLRSSFGIPNLEREIAASPNLFIQALVTVFPREDGCEDSEDWSKFKDDRESNVRDMQSLLRGVKATPGLETDGKIDGIKLMNWVKEARRLSEKFGRLVVGDIQIGRLLSNSPADVDGKWPCDVVRDVLEATNSIHIETGMCEGVLTPLGVVVEYRGKGGDHDRALAEKYRKWQNQVSSRHSFTRSMLGKIAETYERRARTQDMHEEVNSRVGN